MRGCGYGLGPGHLITGHVGQMPVKGPANISIRVLTELGIQGLTGEDREPRRAARRRQKVNFGEMVCPGVRAQVISQR